MVWRSNRAAAVPGSRMRGCLKVTLGEGPRCRTLCLVALWTLVVRLWAVLVDLGLCTWYTKVKRYKV